MKKLTQRQEKWQGMNWIRQEKRLAIYLRDGLACGYCGDSVENGAKLTLDHIKPHCKGGDNKETNLVTCCHRCNAARGARPVNQFATAIAQYLNHNVTAEEIINHVNNTRRRVLPMAEAKALIAKRGTVARVLNN